MTGTFSEVEGEEGIKHMNDRRIRGKNESERTKEITRF
jgi:hypothetical protein